MVNYLGLFVIVIGALTLVVTVGCIIGWLLLTIKELIDKFMERYFPQYYYYDYEDET